MRIAMHMGTLRGAGSSTVGLRLVDALLERDDGHEYTAWLPAETPTPTHPRLRVRRMRPGIIGKFVGENVDIRRELRRGGYDALFSLGDTSLPAPGVPHLLFVQQAYVAYRPEEWGFRPPASMRARMALMTAYFRAGMPTVSLFTVQTETMRRHLCERWSLEPDRVVVVPSAARFAPDEGGDARTPSAEPYICYVAAPSVHKNFEVLPAMLERLARTHPELTLRLTVRREDLPAIAAEAARRGVSERIRWLGPVRDPRELIRGARAFVMPSRLESFGLTYYEALAVGCPVVAADRDFAREACGSAALYADADSPEQFARHVDDILTEPELARRLADAGLERARRAPSWRDAAASYVHLLERIAR